MFRHILLPTDGSDLSESAIRRAIPFARSVNARVTGFHAMPEFHVLSYKTTMLEDTEKEFVRDCAARADRFLAFIEDAARSAGVPCDTAVATSDHPHEAILKAAGDRDCDLIMMASHGRKGVRGLLLGSETQKVLTHGRIPVLVLR
jgi:nucleotide-binding universal stress UspA family protein